MLGFVGDEAIEQVHLDGCDRHFRFGTRRGAIIMVIQNTRQARMQTAISLTSRSAVRSLAFSALQPDFRILWKTSIFQRIAHQRSFSIASAADWTGRRYARIGPDPQARLQIAGYSPASGNSPSARWVGIKQRPDNLLEPGIIRQQAAHMT